MTKHTTGANALSNECFTPYSNFVIVNYLNIKFSMLLHPKYTLMRPHKF